MTNNLVTEMVEGVVRTVDFKKGNGAVESVIFLILIGAVIYLNICSIEVSPLLEKLAIGVLTYWVGLNTKGADSGSSKDEKVA